jgi:hypothetical protein
MTRSPSRLAPLAIVLLSALSGCQDYNFSPVNQCLIQPGAERVTLSDISTADILFVVDDSGSMGGKQVSLQQSFDSFVGNLQGANQLRVQNQLEPIDFHIAITTTSVNINDTVPGGASCQASCAGRAGRVCCSALTNQPLTTPRRCATTADCASAGSQWTCKETNLGLAGELTCGDPAGNSLEDPVACPVLGQECGALTDRYHYTHGPRRCSSIAQDCRAPYDAFCKAGCSGAPATGTYCCDASSAVDPLQCNPGVSTGEYTLYPRGDFVKAAGSASGPPPRVIHFTKDLFCARNATDTACTGPAAAGADAAIQDRINWFKANVMVGTCGSGQEQGLEAGRRALKKALQLEGQAQPLDLDGKAPAWPHARSKLVAVWVGDEDDCSSPESATAGVIMTPTVTITDPDACVLDGQLPAAQQKRYPLDDFASFFGGLGRPLATGFIVSAITNTCADAACRAGLCVDPACTSGPGLCGGIASGVRFIDLADRFRTKGSDVVVGSVCDPGTPTSVPPLPGFSSILGRVAEVVKQPTGLQLPTQPSSASLTILRIVGTDGKTRKTCSSPAPVGTSGAALDAYDWWFSDGNDLNAQVPRAASRFITINRTVRRCEANPGETYSADYLGLVPVGGCDTALDCSLALGLRKTDWVCQKEAGALPGDRGTCLCGG